MHSHTRYFIAILLFFCLIPCACGQETDSEWEDYEKKISQHYQRGDLKQAIVVAKEALKEIEQKKGKSHIEVASILDIIGNTYNIMEFRAANANKIGHYTYGVPKKPDPKKAFQYFERALKIRESALGPHHTLVAESLNPIVA